MVSHVLSLITETPSAVPFGANALPPQAACDKIFACLHHVLPHLIRATLFIEKYANLFPAHRAAMFVGESQYIRNRDFGHYSFSILLFSGDIHPAVPRAPVTAGLPLAR